MVDAARLWQVRQLPGGPAVAHGLPAGPVVRAAALCLQRRQPAGPHAEGHGPGGRRQATGHAAAAALIDWPAERTRGVLLWDWCGVGDEASMPALIGQLSCRTGQWRCVNQSQSQDADIGPCPCDIVIFVHLYRVAASA